MIITSEIKQYLNKEKIALGDFQKVIMRLLDSGVICRDESLIEQETYDTYLRLNELIIDFFSLLNMQILHDTTFQFVRVFPPGANIPGEKDDFITDYRGFRRTLNQQEVTLLLVLRVLYEQKVLEGHVSDKGTVDVTLEDIHITFTQSLNRELPDKLIDRKAMYQTLKRLRVIQYNADELDGNQCLVSIRPIISSYTFEHVESDAEHEMELNSDKDENGLEEPNAHFETSVNSSLDLVSFDVDVDVDDDNDDKAKENKSKKMNSKKIVKEKVVSSVKPEKLKKASSTKTKEIKKEVNKEAVKKIKKKTSKKEDEIEFDLDASLEEL